MTVAVTGIIERRARRSGLRYLLYVPRRYARGHPLPLLVMLHGCTQDAADFARGTRIGELAALRGFIACYPEQSRTAHERRCWNWFDPANQVRGSGEPAAIASVVHDVVAEFAVDRTRVYIAGLSAGAAMASVVAVAYPELFARLVLHSGLPYGAAGSVQSALAAMGGRIPPTTDLVRLASRAMGPRLRAIPALVIHGAADPVVAPSNARATAEQWAGVALLARGGGNWVTRDHTWRPDPVHTCHVTTLSANGVLLAEEWLIDGLEHAWSGGSALGSFTDPTSPDASELALKFLAL